MSSVNWDKFSELPGGANKNFELLCRAIIRCHYGQFGQFRALANQPGVEFHVKLHSQCGLGGDGHWYGWQCRWYDLPRARAIGTTRREKIENAITKTERVLPELTDWVLWTRYPMTKGDQKWFDELQTRMHLHLWTSDEVEEHLSGPAEVLRGTYFGELILTASVLGALHSRSVAHIRGMWLPEVHQVVDAERKLQRALGRPEVWSGLSTLAARIENGANTLNTATLITEPLRADTAAFVDSALEIKNILKQSRDGLVCGDLEILREVFAHPIRPSTEWDAFTRRLRAARHELVLGVTNMLADMHSSISLLRQLEHALSSQVFIVLADAGYGKTHLAAQLTTEDGRRPAGLLIHGRDLHARQNLDDLAQRVTVNGNPISSFEALVAAVDAAGQRAGFRLPIFIDGLNEAEDPRDWKPALASATEVLALYPHVLLVCSARPDFVLEAVPDNTERLELPGFDRDLSSAVTCYFKHYLIDPSDAALHWQLFNHPLKLRLFCEVTNPKREKSVGVEAMPSSLTALFERYLEQVAQRICALCPRSWRYFESDVRSAISRLGLALWKQGDRSIDKDELRTLLKDNTRPWDQSIVRALEQDGVLIRVSAPKKGDGNVSVVYDALAGHIIADALLEEYEGEAFESWLVQEGTIASPSMEPKRNHPLAADILNGLVGLTPRRRHRRQFWLLAPEPMRPQALYEAAWLESRYLDDNTVSELAALVVAKPLHGRDLFDRLWITRAARTHPLDARFLDSVLRPMSIQDRDLRWTEWVRGRHADVLVDLQDLEERWKGSVPGQQAEQLRARWVMWTLTSTVRLLRDHATRALYLFGCSDSAALFDLALGSLEINDPYVPERMVAASYGVAMSLWADPRGEDLRAALPGFASAIVDQMFVPEAPHPTRHALLQDSAFGIIDLARRLVPDCIAESKLGYTMAPFNHLPSPFSEPSTISDTRIADAKDAIRMDFGNYTIGRLVPGRGNYDDDHPTFQNIRRQIEARIMDLGYSSSRFSEIDEYIATEAWRAEERGIASNDRYAKKYSWIAYYEMYSVCRDVGLLSKPREEQRPSDVDIDPSFPTPARIWAPKLADLFYDEPRDSEQWIVSGPTPDYQGLLNPDYVDGQLGSWILLEGFVDEYTGDGDRRIFTILRGVLVDAGFAKDLILAFDAKIYPGNSAIPEPTTDYYTYAGEIPWSDRFGSCLRDPWGEALPDERIAFRSFGSHPKPGIPVEVPVCGFCWEGYHSTLNKVSNITLPAPAICQKLGLSNRQGEWDFYDPEGRVATLYRKLSGHDDKRKGFVAYIRSGLLEKYVRETGKALVWLQWGERGFDYKVRIELTENVRSHLGEWRHIHKRHESWSA